MYIIQKKIITDIIKALRNLCTNTGDRGVGGVDFIRLKEPRTNKKIVMQKITKDI